MVVEAMWSQPRSRRACKDSDAGSPPYHRPLPRRSRCISSYSSPFRSSSAVPFSWERRPGIPKAPCHLSSRSFDHLLPLPPPLRPSHASAQKKRPAIAEDPFAVALAECAKPPPGPSIEELFTRTGSTAVPPRRGASSSMFFGLDLASCKAACAVADSDVYVPRLGLRAGASYSSSYGLLNRRLGG